MQQNKPLLFKLVRTFTTQKIHKLHRPKSYWNLMENQRIFMNGIAKQLNITQPSDWSSISIRRIYELEGSALLSDYYNNSLFSCLQSVYADIDWKNEWQKTPTSYWKSIENQKNFLNDIAKKQHIKEPKDWGKVSVRIFHKNGGKALLSRYYNNSLLKCLQSVYNDIDWKEEWFSKLPKSYWDALDTRKKFMDHVALKINIKQPSDWGKIPVQRIQELGGNTILHYYNNSLFTCLQSIYKDIEWKREWFHNISRFPKSHWNSFENCRKFIADIATKSNVSTTSDWKKVTVGFIRNKGGSGLISKYGNSLKSLLQGIYPSINWKDILPYEKTFTEGHLCGLVQGIFPNEAALQNHRKHRLHYGV